MPDPPFRRDSDLSTSGTPLRWTSGISTVVRNVDRSRVWTCPAQFGCAVHKCGAPAWMQWLGAVGRRTLLSTGAMSRPDAAANKRHRAQVRHPAFETKRQGSRQLRGVDKLSRSCGCTRSHASRAQERIDARCPQRATPPSLAIGLGIRHRTAVAQRVPRTVVHTDAGLLEKARKTPEFGGFCDARAKTYDKTCPQASTATAAATGRRMRHVDEQCIAGCSGHLSESVVTAMAAVLAAPRGGWGLSTAWTRPLRMRAALSVGAGCAARGEAGLAHWSICPQRYGIAPIRSRAGGRCPQVQLRAGCVLAAPSFGPAIPHDNGRIC